MHLVAVEFDLLVHVARETVHSHAHEARLAHVLEDGLVVPLAVLDQRRQHLEASAGLHPQHRVHDLLGGLPGDLAAALWAVDHSDAGVQEPQVVVNLGDGADGRAGIARAPPLVNGDGRGEPLDLVHVRLLHLAEELARVGGEALDVPSLPLGVDGVEGQGGLARPRDAGDDHHLVARDLDGDILQVVLSCAPHDDLILNQCLPLLCSIERLSNVCSQL